MHLNRMALAVAMAFPLAFSRRLPLCSPAAPSPQHQSTGHRHRWSAHLAVHTDFYRPGKHPANQKLHALKLPAAALELLPTSGGHGH